MSVVCYISQPGENAVHVLRSALAAGDHEARVQAPKRLEFRRIALATLFNRQAFEHPELPLRKARFHDELVNSQNRRGFPTAPGGAAVDGIELGGLELDRGQVMALTLRKPLAAHAAEDALSVQLGRAVPQA
jgi:hypothetical protein